ncbi:MAG: PQQ-binding-like beta-propeller repeat protein [Acidimicrobiales bacterium]
MHRLRILLAVVLLAAACGTDDPLENLAATPTSPVATSTTVGADTPPVSMPDATEPRDWALPGADYHNSRQAIGSSIDAGTVELLARAWSAEMAGPLSTVPIVVDGVVYAQAGNGAVSAIDASTGEVRWTSAPTGFNIGPFGAAVADGRVFAVYGSTGVVALDAATGDEVWVAEITATPTTGIDIQPVVYDGLVFVSTVPVSISGIYVGGDRGVLHALDAATGEVVWTFDTVLGDDLWGNPDVNSGGGSWYPPAIDPERGLVYWGVANPAPFPGTAEFPNGSSRPGPNLYTNSAVALDIATGELQWYHQVIPHDIFDRDLVHTMIVDLADGSDLVVATGKGATVVGIDPDTGAPLWETPVGRHENDELDEIAAGTTVYPGTYGGVLTPPASADGTVYVATLNAPSTLSPDATFYFGGDLGTEPGEVVAIDAASGGVLWATSVPGDPLGGVAVVNDLLLTALLDGTVLALSRATGEIVHELSAPGGINGWMSVVDDTIYVPVGQASPPQIVAYRVPG